MGVGLHGTGAGEMDFFTASRIAICSCAPRCVFAAPAPQLSTRKSKVARIEVSAWKGDPRESIRPDKLILNHISRR